MNNNTGRPVYIDVVELAAQLGLSVATIYKWRSSGQDLPVAFKIGSRVRWRQDEVDTWLDRQQESARIRHA